MTLSHHNRGRGRGQKRKAQLVGPFWEFYSRKAGRIIRVRGDLRYYLGVLLEANPCYRTLTPRSVKIHARIASVWVTVEIDFAVRDSAGVDYYFCAEYRNKLEGPRADVRSLRRIAAVGSWAHQTGSRFAVWSDTMIWKDRRFLSNWAHLLRILAGYWQAIDTTLEERLARVVAFLGSTTVGSLKAQMSDYDPTLVEAALFAQVHAGNLLADLSSAPLSNHTPICHNESTN